MNILLKEWNAISWFVVSFNYLNEAKYLKILLIAKITLLYNYNLLIQYLINDQSARIFYKFRRNMFLYLLISIYSIQIKDICKNYKYNSVNSKIMNKKCNKHFHNVINKTMFKILLKWIFKTNLAWQIWLNKTHHLFIKMLSVKLPSVIFMRVAASKLYKHIDWE